MPIVVNSNASATTASFNLSRANDALRKSLGRLSSGNRINTPADDAGGLAVAYKLNSKAGRTSAILQNSQNALSYLQVQDSGLQTAGKIVDRMAELRVMSQDITKNTQDIENYSKEFIELQSQLNQVSKEKFNGISLFASSTATAAGTLKTGTASFSSASYNSFSRTLLTHDSGVSTMGSIKLNVVNFQFMLSSLFNLFSRTDTCNSCFVCKLYYCLSFTNCIFAVVIFIFTSWSQSISISLFLIIND